MPPAPTAFFMPACEALLPRPRGRPVFSFCWSASSDPAPDPGINSEWRCPRSRNVHEAAMMGDMTVPEQPSEQCEGVLRQDGVNKAFLPG